MYGKVQLSDHTLIGDPGALPDRIVGLANESLADLTFTPIDEFDGIGYWPVVAEDHDPAIETLSDDHTVDVETKTVIRAKRSKTSEEMEPLRAALRAAAMAKRDEMIDAGITFGGTAFQTRPEDRENIAGAAQLAFMAIVAGAQPNDLLWHGGEHPFGWIALDNSVVTMDAQTVIEFARAAAARKSACIFYARALKEAIDAAGDPRAVNINAGWPA